MIENKTVIIKTYLHKSGLLYLAKSLAEELQKNGCKVIFAPKARYVMQGSIYNREYFEVDEAELAGFEVCKFSNKKTVREQLLSTAVKHGATHIISFETLMEKAGWVQFFKSRKGFKVIDVPMPEWVSPRYLKGRSYNIFDEIWCLTDQSKELFDQHVDNAKRVSWEFANSEVFNSKKRLRRKTGPVKYYHAASLNPEYSSKNTDLVVKAFEKLLSNYDDVSLDISGLISNKFTEKIIEKHSNINIIGEGLEPLLRDEQAKIYKACDCVVAPSSREGLGLSLYEALACKTKLITTNSAPMNEVDSKYLCNVESYKNDGKAVLIAILNSGDIYEQLERVYKDIKNERKSNNKRNLSSPKKNTRTDK